MQRNRAFTLIELLVVIAVVGLLVALLLPAVQAAREASRRLGCLNNLRQVGIALHGYLDACGSLPYGYGAQSAFYSILPYLEQASLYDALNLSNSPFYGDDPARSTVSRTSVAAFLCPSDPSAHSWRSSYAASVGTIYGDGAFAADISTHPFVSFVSPAAVPDGLSTTCAVAEWLVTYPNDGSWRRRPVFLLDGGSAGSPYDLDRFTRDCLNSRDNVLVGSFMGSSWLDGILGGTLFTTTMGINSASCLNIVAGSPRFAYTAGSLHPGGGNVLFLDGHAVFVKDSVTLAVWRATGTRAGGEIIAGGLE